MSALPRASGILLHPSSLPGPFGIGDLGAGARRFIDWLAAHGQTYWQILPLGPTSYGDSPYQTLSAFAGNSNLISLDALAADGLLSRDDLESAPPFPRGRVDYGGVISHREQILARAWQRFQAGAAPALHEQLERFVMEHTFWLEEYALYMAIKRREQMRPWTEWDSGLRQRESAALQAARNELAADMASERFRQWLFWRQWAELRAYAVGRGIHIIGDLPIFVAHDSADVWARQEEYALDAAGKPTVVAGVPPDYFSPTGQRWGNPLYRWQHMRARGYDWWLQRLRTLLQLVDRVRIDHFRGFEAYWEIPAQEPTAIRGRWVTGPGAAFFRALQASLGELPIIAEDLGEITPAVEQLRDDLGLPGMKVLQFAWSDPSNPFLPHNIPQRCIVYTGTHDNNTTRGWWEQEADACSQAFVRDYLGHEARDIVWALARAGMASVGAVFIMPMQDVLGCGAEARMNTPGSAAGNWAWRFDDSAWQHPGGQTLLHVTRLFQRHPEQQ